MKTNKQKGFTLVELVVMLFVATLVSTLVFWVFVISVLFKGNYWYDEASVLRELRISHPKAERILKTTRSVWEDSEITVFEAGKQTTYYLNSDIFFNYEFRQKEAFRPPEASAPKEGKEPAGRRFWF